MKKNLFIFFVSLIVAGILQTHFAQALPLQFKQTIPLPHVEGRIDHLAIDLQGRRLFVAALGNNTVEVLNLETGQWLQSLKGFDEPQGILFLPEVNKLFVTNGGNGRCDIFDGSSLNSLGNVSFASDADNIRYDETRKMVHIGYGSGALGMIDPKTEKRIGDISLGGHPESFQIEKSGHRIFVNVPSHRVVVVDKEKGTVLTTWSGGLLKRGNYPLALDETDHRLFVVYRWPSKIVVFDTESGKTVAELESPGDADDIFYDAIKKRIYVSGGEGFLLVVQQGDVDQYQVLSKIQTAPGARTSLFVPELNRLYVAVPRRGSQGAEIRVFDVKP